MSKDRVISNNKFKIIIFFIVLLSLFSIVFAHGGGEEEQEIHEEETIDLEHYIKSTASNYILIASIIAIVLVLFSIFYKEKTEKMKVVLFLGIAIPIILATVYSAGSTIYLNLISETKGPVHWHADYEIWTCGNKIDLIKPRGISNRIGSAVFHDHGDNRIHVEGVVTDKENVDLHNFFEIVGGYLDNSRLKIPTDQEIVEVKNLDLCNGQEGKLQVFLYKIKNPDATKNWVFEQQKLDNFEDYVLSHYSQIPPGDCIIIEFDVEKEKTGHICGSYSAAIERGDLSGG